MKKLFIITLNVILVAGFLNLRSQNEHNYKESNIFIKGKDVTDLYSTAMDQILTTSFDNQKNTSSVSDYGDSPNLNWKGQFGGSGSDNVNAVVSDENGNIYITGSFSGQMSLDGNTYVTTGSREVFIAKLDNSGSIIWLTQIPPTENNKTYGKDICMDNNGNIYVTGYYTGLITVGESNLPDNNDFSLFYAKLNNQGELLNGGYHSQDMNEIGFSIDVDDSENIFIVCSRSNTIDYRHPSWLLKYDQSNNLIRATQYEVGFNNLLISDNTIYYSGVIQGGDNGYIDENVTLVTPTGYSDVFIAKSNLDGIFEWGIVATHDAFGDSGNDCLILDNQGNLFMAGTYRGNLTLGNYSITNAGTSSGFITKFNSQGNFAWLSQYLGSTVRLSSDPSGNAYVTGNSSLSKYNNDGILQWTVEQENEVNSICFNNNSKIIIAGSNSDLNYITQLSNEAAEEWTTQFEGNSAFGYAIGMVTDNKGAIYTYNYTSGTIDYFGETVNEGIFICKQSGHGEVAWLKQFPNTKVEYGYGNHIVIDLSFQNIYITGNFDTEITLPDGTTLTPSVNGSIFILKFDINGVYQWSIQEDFKGSSLCLAADYAGNILLSGTFSGTISIDGTELVTAGGDDCFMAKYDGNANLVWAKRAGGESIEYSSFVSVDGSNNVYLTGEFISENVTVDNTPHSMLAGDGNIIFAKFNPVGEVTWVKSFAASNHDWYDDVSWPTGMKTDINGNTYIKGNFSYLAYFDGILLENPESYFNKFIVKIDSDGNALWANQITQPKKNHQFDYNQFDIDGDGNVYFGVQAEDTLFFGTDFQYYPSSSHDLFVAKYSTGGSLNWVKTMKGDEYSYSWISSVAAYNSTNVFVSGFFDSYLSIDNEELSSTSRHGFISMFGENISGFTEVYNSVELEIYPNPANSIITISTDKPFKNAVFNIYSILGKVVKTGLVNNQNELDVSNLQEGSYIIKIYLENKVYVSKFIKL